MTFLESGEVLVHRSSENRVSALQQSLAAARRQMRGQGAVPGKKFSHWTASCSALGISTHPSIRPAGRSRSGERFAQRVGGKDRAVVSSEQFADASPELVAGSLATSVADRVLLTVLA